MSHRSFRTTLTPSASGLVAAIAVFGVLAAAGSAPALGAAGGLAAGYPVRGQEWWLSGLHVAQAWRTTEGTGVTVAVLSTGVAVGHPDLAGAVITGPDYTGSGRTPGGAFWGIDGTEVASVIAGHGHGTGGVSGIIGIAPAAKILSVRVTLEFNDPLTSDQAIARRLPGAIAAGITYAVDHGAQIIDLPLDPGTLGLSSNGNPVAAGASPAEQAAAAAALRKNVVLVAPAGDDGQGPGLVDYPAAYPGVIAVGAVGRNGQLALFSSRQSYVSLTAPGVDLASATPPAGYARISSTGSASGIVAGVAALILSRFPHLLTVTQVTQALTGSTIATAATDRTAGLGAGHGTVDAARAVDLAAAIISAGRARQQTGPTARPHKPARQPAASQTRPAAGSLAGSLVRDVVAALAVLIVLVVVLLLVMRSRRQRAGGAGSGRAHARGLHEQRRPERAAVPGRDATALPGLPQRPLPASPVAPTWPAPGGWQGGSVGEIARSPSAPFRPAVTSAPKTAKAAGSKAGPPWEPAPEPERMIGPLPMPNSGLPAESGFGIRVPGDMASLPAATTDPPPAPFDLAASPDPDFPPRPADAQGTASLPDFPTSPDLLTSPEFLSQQSLGFAAAPVPTDYPPLPVPDFTVPSRAAGFVLSAGATSAGSVLGPDSAPEERPAPGPAADPGYIWDLAATDVFPAVTDRGAPPETPGTPDDTPPQDEDPGAS